MRLAWAEGEKRGVRGDGRKAELWNGCNCQFVSSTIKTGGHVMVMCFPDCYIPQVFSKRTAELPTPNYYEVWLMPLWECFLFVSFYLFWKGSETEKYPQKKKRKMRNISKKERKMRNISKKGGGGGGGRRNISKNKRKWEVSQGRQEKGEISQTWEGNKKEKYLKEGKQKKKYLKEGKENEKYLREGMENEKYLKKGKENASLTKEPSTSFCF